jgi:hypothetical protein
LSSDDFWDRGLEDNSQLPISVAPAIDEIVDGSRQVFTPSVSNRPNSITGPYNSFWSELLSLGNSLELVSRIC